MNIWQAIIFWLMILASLSTFRDIERARGTQPEAPKTIDGFIAVRREWML
jgi:hypothetical protein